MLLLRHLNERKQKVKDKKMSFKENTGFNAIKGNASFIRRSEINAKYSGILLPCSCKNREHFDLVLIDTT